MDINENAVVGLLLQHRLATPHLLSRLLGRNDTQIKNDLRHLRRKQVIESFPFIGKQVYYRLTEPTCRQLGVSRRYAGPPGPQAIRQYFGLLHFSAHQTPPRHFLTDADWHQLAVDYEQPGINKPSGELYLDVEDHEETEPAVEAGLEIVTTSGVELCDIALTALDA